MADWLAQFDDEVSTMLGGTPYRPAEAKSYAPTLRDRIAGYLMGDERASTYKARFVEGLLGSRGMGTTGVGLADVTPLGIPMGIQDAIRAGDPNAVALAIMPGGGVANKAGQKVAKEAAGEVKQGIRAYHGSPHDFDRFDMSKIGKGEGVQAYGHGLYFAENVDVANKYKDAAGQFPISAMRPEDYASIVLRHVTTRGMRPEDVRPAAIAHLDALIAEQTDVLGRVASLFSRDKRRETEVMRDARAALAEGRDIPIKPNIGHLYEVNIKANPNDFLDWDKPLNQQPERIRRAMTDLANGEVLPDSSGMQAYRSVASQMMTNLDLESVELAKRVKDAGIPGIKYLDQGSRATGEGSRNYVVFDDKLIDIVKKYGIAATAAALGMSQADFKAQFERSQQK